MDFFEKSLADMSIADITWLVENQIREGQDLEFKALPAEHGGKENIWLKPDGAVTREGKKALLKELVAFANANGGTLVFGISETGSCASGITPIPNVEACAEKLRLACRDSIEPAIPQLEIQGIPVPETDGAGVIVLRVMGQSPMGPHRSNSDKEFYVRRNDRSDPMTVDEIRRYSIDLNIRLNSIHGRFAIHSQKLSKMLDAADENNKSFCISCYLVPLTPIHIENVFRNYATRPELKSVDVFDQGKKIGSAYIPTHGGMKWVPKIRGSEGRFFWTDAASVSLRIMSDGEIELTWMDPGAFSRGKDIYLSWIMGVFANALLTVERLRRVARVGSLEYLAQVSIGAKSLEKPLALQGYADPRFGWQGWGEVPLGMTSFPILPITIPGSFSDLCVALETDVLNCVGFDRGPRPPIFDFEPPLNELQQELRG